VSRLPARHTKRELEARGTRTTLIRPAISWSAAAKTREVGSNDLHRSKVTARVVNVIEPDTGPIDLQLVSPSEADILSWRRKRQMWILIVKS
jgi:hypothetical protein